MARTKHPIPIPSRPPKNPHSKKPPSTSYLSSTVSSRSAVLSAPVEAAANTTTVASPSSDLAKETPVVSLPIEASSVLSDDVPSVENQVEVLPVPAVTSSSTDAPPKCSWADLVSPTGGRMNPKGTPYTLPSGELCIKIPKEVIMRNKKRWETFIIAQFHGTPPSPGTLHGIVNGIWSNKLRDISVSQSSEKSFLIRIPSAATRRRVLAQVMWIVDNQSMFVAKFEPGLKPTLPVLTSVPVWLDFHAVPAQFFSEEGLGLIASMVGKPLYLHPSTAQMTNITVARVFTIIDPTKPLPEAVHVEFPSGEIGRIGVSSPWLPPTCSFCKVIGHAQKRCPLAPITCPACKSTVHTSDSCPRKKQQHTPAAAKTSTETISLNQKEGVSNQVSTKHHTTIYRPKAIPDKASTSCPPTVPLGSDCVSKPDVIALLNPTVSVSTTKVTAMTNPTVTGPKTNAIALPIPTPFLPSTVVNATRESNTPGLPATNRTLVIKEPLPLPIQKKELKVYTSRKGKGIADITPTLSDSSSDYAESDDSGNPRPPGRTPEDEVAFMKVVSKRSKKQLSKSAAERSIRSII